MLCDEICRRQCQKHLGKWLCTPTDLLFAHAASRATSNWAGVHMHTQREKDGEEEEKERHTRNDWIQACSCSRLYHQFCKQEIGLTRARQIRNYGEHSSQQKIQVDHGKGNRHTHNLPYTDKCFNIITLQPEKEEDAWAKMKTVLFI